MANEKRVIIDTDLAAPAEPATSQSIVVGDLVFLSAQNGRMPNGAMPADFVAQMKNAMYNSRAILEAAGSDLLHTIRVSINITDAFYMPQTEEIYKYFFPTQDPPTREITVVSSLSHGALVQVTITALNKMNF